MSAGLRGEFGRIARLAAKVWGLIPTNRRWELAGAALIMMLTSIGNTAVALLLGVLIDRIQSGVAQEQTATQLYTTAAKILGTLCLIYLTRELLNVYRRYLVENSCTSINRDMQTRLVEHLLKIPLNALSKEKIGTLHGKIFRSVDGLVHFIRLMGLECVPAFLTGVIALTAAVTKQPFLGLVMIGVVPLSLLLTLRQLASQQGVRVELMRACEDIDGIVVEQFQGTEYIRVANTLELEVERLSRATEHRRKREIWHHVQMSFYGCAKSLNEGFFHVAVLGLATYLAINHQISFGDILTFSVLFLNVMTPLNEIHRVIDEGQESSLRVAELLEMLEQPEDPSFFASKNAHAVPLSHGKPAIQIRDLVLDYVDHEGKFKRGLDGLNLSIQHGQTIGVAGPSGAGKSTWIKVLLRLLHPTSGEIQIGNVPLTHLDRRELANMVSYVGQNPFVFSGTVRENIAYGNGVVDPAMIEQAAESANLRQEILEMPAGFESPILERGLNVSGGQRQRLAIARILIKNSPILILDEATSALDNLSERHVQHSLGISNRNRTTIVIAHRLSTLQDCDQILVFDHGRIVEIGSYHELIERNGLFAQLVASGEGALNGA